MGGKGQRESRKKKNISIAACTDEDINFTLEGPCSRNCHKLASLDLYHVHVHACAHTHKYIFTYYNSSSDLECIHTRVLMRASAYHKVGI